MTNSDLLQLRLRNHRLAGPNPADPETVVRWLGAVQAQDYQQSLWATGVCTRHSTVTDTERAIADRKIVRTWPMRGTLHFVSAGDVQWMLRLTAADVIARHRRRREQLEVDGRVLDRCQRILHDALRGGRQLSRSDVFALLDAEGIATNHQRGYHVLWYAAQTGLICLGPMQGKQQTFVLLDEWVPRSQELSREESLRELAQRYFASHGPATVQDFAWWSGLPIAVAREGHEAAKLELTSVAVNDRQYWLGENDPGRSADGESAVHLLPAFDEYLLGYRDRSPVLAPEQATKVFPGKSGIFLPIVILDGQVVGKWKRTVSRGCLKISVSPFAWPSSAEEKILLAAERYAAFLGVPASSIRMEWTT